MFTSYTMDWAGAIARNSVALRVIVAGLFAMLGVEIEARLPYSLHRAVLRVLRPAESAVRRLIVIAARGLVVKPVPSRPMTVKPVAKGGPSRPPRFKLFDHVRTFAEVNPEPRRGVTPRIHVFVDDPRVAAIFAARRVSKPTPLKDGLITGQLIMRRLQALKSALDDLPRQAKRLVRIRLRQKVFRSPLRPGPPPGHRKRKVHEIDEILAECHGLARDALKEDTS